MRGLLKDLRELRTWQRHLGNFQYFYSNFSTPCCVWVGEAWLCAKHLVLPNSTTYGGDRILCGLVQDAAYRGRKDWSFLLFDAFRSSWSWGGSLLWRASPLGLPLSCEGHTTACEAWMQQTVLWRRGLLCQVSFLGIPLDSHLYLSRILIPFSLCSHPCNVLG